MDVNFSSATLFQLLGYALVLLGVAGTVLPLLPGPVLIWLGILAWAWGDGFVQVNWLVLAILGILALLAWGSDLFFTTAFTRKAGVSWKAVFGSIVTGILGGIFLSQLPFIGTLFGALLGALLGMLVIERYDKHNWPAAFAGVRAYIGATILSTVFEVTVAALMVGIFVWQAWL
jgi:uncharacterized protein